MLRRLDGHHLEAVGLEAALQDAQERGVGLDELTLALLDQADTILEIVTYDATTIRNTIAMAETFQKIGYPPSSPIFVAWTTASLRDETPSFR